MPDIDEADRSPLDFAGLLDNLPGMVYRCRADRVWTLDYVSAGALGLTGFRPDELLTGDRRAFARLILPMDRRGVEVAVEAAVAAGQPYTLEYRICDRAGLIKQVWERGRLVHGEGPTAVLEGIIIDISTLRRAESDLRERVKELQLLHDIVSLSSAEVPLDEALWRIAERIPHGYCYPPEVAARIRLEGRVYTSPRFVADACSQSAPIVIGGRVAGAIEVCRISDGGASPVSYFLREEQEMLNTVAARIGSLAERAQMLAALRASERHARDLYERLPVPTVVWQRRGDDFVLAHHNQAALVATEGRVRGWVGLTFGEVLPGRPDLEGELHACARATTTSRRELEFALPGGRTLVLMVSLGFVPPDLVLAHVVDVTRERTVERRVQEAQKLEVLGRMAAGIAHDFNNFLTVILGYTKLFASTAAPDRPASVDLADLEEIRTASERAAALTQQLLTFSRREAVQPGPVDVNAKVRELRGMLVRLLGEDRTLTTALAGAPCVVTIGAGQLDQLLINLVINARDATGPGGQVVIATATLAADDAARLDLAPTPHVALSVGDDGSGMDAATRARIFEPFFTTKPAGMGTGMGLAIVYGIARQAGGTVTVESEPGRGATFRVYLPRTAELVATAEDPAAATRAGARGGETILVIEDSEPVRRLVLDALDSAGYRVLTASDAAEALLVCERQGGAVDLLITELVLPWTSGTALATRITALCPGVRVLFMSGYVERAQQVAGELDAASFIAKPFAGAALLGLVRRILGGEPPGVATDAAPVTQRASGLVDSPDQEDMSDRS